MYSSCPTSHPDHLSETLLINSNDEDDTSEAKLSSVILTLLNMENKGSSPFTGGSVTHWERRSTCWKVGDSVQSWAFKERRGEIGGSCICQPGG